MLITIVYDDLEMYTGQNYAELWSGELELWCRALNKSKTPRETLSYHRRTSDVLVTIICNNWEIITHQNYAELSSAGPKLWYKTLNKSRTLLTSLAYQYKTS